MNQKLNTWLCKHFDRESEEEDILGNITRINKKGYVTLWNIIQIAILEPLIVFVMIVLVLFLALIIPGCFIVSTTENLRVISSLEIINVLIYGLLMWIAVGILFGAACGIYALFQYKVAICPLAEKKPDEYGAPQDDDSRLRPDLKEAEEKMFKDILKD